MKEELENQEMLRLVTFTQSMPTSTFLNVIASGMTLDQKLDLVLENYSKEDASNSEER